MGRFRDFLKRITGIFTPIGGINWTPPPEQKSNPTSYSRAPSSDDRDIISSSDAKNILDDFFDIDHKRLPKLILEWRDKILGKVEQLRVSGANLNNAKKKIKKISASIVRGKKTICARS